MPYTSAVLNLNSGTTDIIPASMAAACPGLHRTRMASGNYKKNMWQLTNLPASGSLSVSNCDMPNGVWDSVSALLSCDVSTGSCECTANDDACGGSAGERVSGIPLSSSRVYYHVIMPYSS